ncbi:MAG TPA: hypothetical protein VIC26_06680 [Marinagarivorans sp.]
MAYVDLNPIRAKMAEAPETSDHTSIKQRITAAKNNQPIKNLAQFVGNPREPMPQGLPFALVDYIELVDWTGRVIRDDTQLHCIHAIAGLVNPMRQRGHIATTLPPIIDRLGIEQDNWLELTRAFEKNTKTFVGAGEHIESAALTMGYQRTPNRRRCQSLFG